MAYVDEARVVSLAKVLQYAGFVEVGQSCHVFNLVKLRRVHLLSGVQIDFNFLMQKNEGFSMAQLTLQGKIQLKR